MTKRSLFLALLVLVGAAPGCLHSEEEHTAYARAQADLGCSDVELTELPGNGYVASGCGRSEQLTCSTSSNPNPIFRNVREYETTCFTSAVVADAPPPTPDEPTVDEDAARREQVRYILRSIPHDDCGTGGEGALEITFSPNGTVHDVVVASGDYDDTTKQCLESRFSAAHVSPFSGSPRTYGWRIHLPQAPGA